MTTPTVEYYRLYDAQDGLIDEWDEEDSLEKAIEALEGYPGGFIELWEADVERERKGYFDPVTGAGEPPSCELGEKYFVREVTNWDKEYGEDE